MTAEKHGRAGTEPRKRRTVSHTRPAEPLYNGAVQRELARLRRENELLRAKLRSTTPIPRTLAERGPPRRAALTPGSLAAHAVVAERYELEHVLARGGMGAVWVARDLETGTRVAVKFLKGEADPQQIARFEREAEVCKRLQSKHVVRILSHGVDGGNHYLAMELLRGESLSTMLRRRGALTLAEACQLVNDLADALEPAHAAGIVHRDLKPQNLFLSAGGEGAERTLKLLDFGVAKELANTVDMTASGEIIGSPNYMSPEQAYGVRGIDHRSDLWAVAVILYRVITGNKPWEGDNPLELLLKICTEPAPPPSVYNPRFFPSMDTFFARAFAQNPAERFASIHELAAAFNRAASTASMPPPPTASPRSPLPNAQAPSDVNGRLPLQHEALASGARSPRQARVLVLVGAALALIACAAAAMLY